MRPFLFFKSRYFSLLTNYFWLPLVTYGYSWLFTRSKFYHEPDFLRSLKFKSSLSKWPYFCLIKSDLSKDQYLSHHQQMHFSYQHVNIRNNFLQWGRRGDWFWKNMDTRPDLHISSNHSQLTISMLYRSSCKVFSFLLEVLFQFHLHSCFWRFSL